MVDVTILPMPGGTASPQLLDAAHYDAFSRALLHLLATDSARETLAQLMDGLPLFSVVKNTVGAINLNDAPIRQHTTLCEGSRDRAKEFISQFNPASLQFEPSLLQSFQDSVLTTRPPLFRLLELLCRSIHCIAVSIERTAIKSHKGDIREAMEYQEPPMPLPVGSNGRQRFLPSLRPYASLFFHPSYRYHEQYPFGTADMAGYWAEDRIFGGVVLFDRTESGKAAESVWCHSARKGWTIRVWKPLEWQLTAMENYFSTGRVDCMAEEADKREAQLSPKQLRAMDSRWKSTFPFFCDVDNFERHDDLDAMAYHHIYRDPWERRLPPEKVERCSQRVFDYPERAPIIEAAMYYPGPSYSVSGNFELPPTHDTSEVPCNENQKDKNKTTIPVTGTQEGTHRYPVKGRLIGYMDGQEFKYADSNFDMDKYREALRRSGTDITQQKSTGNPVGTFMGHEIRAHYDEVHLAAELAANDWKLPDERERNDKPETESDSLDEQAP